MKGSSQDRSTPQNRLNKTQQQLPPKPDYLDNTYQQPKRATEKTVQPPRTGSTQKINYKIEDNMTNSKIQQAKQGLLLLKKKMSRNGMSRDKAERNTSIQKTPEEDYNPKKTVYKQQQVREQYQEQEYKKPASKITTREQPTKKTPPIPTKASEERPIKRLPPRQEFSNPNQEIPIKGNQDFMAILEREMAKEEKPQAPISKGAKKPIYQEQVEVELIQCTKGCGRQFNSIAIEKHEKVCEKVFQSKRKAFNSAAFRQPDTSQDFKPPPPMPSVQIREEKTKKKEQKIPKWKQQSAAFRAGLKLGRGQEPTAEEKALADQANGMIVCGTCGRKFNETAGKRHIAFCESKAKQMPKMNTSKRK